MAKDLEFNVLIEQNESRVFVGSVSTTTGCHA